MLLKPLRPIVAAFGHLLVWCCLATAEQGGVPVAPEQTSPPSGTTTGPFPRVEETRPSVYYLPDKQGVLQPVLDFQYQDFVNLYKLKNQLEQRDEPPRYSLQRMTATGSAGQEYAELTVQFQALVRDDGWVRIPLRLDQGVLRGAVNYKGTGEQSMHYEADGEGYVCWVRGKADSQHEITLTILVPLSVVADETWLKLFTPRATASELKLKVPITGAVGKVSEGATLLPPAAAENGATVLNAVGLGGEFLVAWRKPNPRQAETPPVLEAAGSVLTRLDGRSISAEATLSVRSYGAAFDRFAVQLPPGTELSPATTNGYVVVPKEPEGKENAARREVVVQLPKKTAGPVEVRLACRRNYDPLKESSWCELAGFEVVGAARQWGTVAVAAAGGWQVLWGTSNEVRETDQLPDWLRKEDVVASFEYSTQPYSLNARLTPRKTRIGVNPRYILLIDQNEIRLEGTLTYTIRGAKTATLDVGIPGWEFDEVGPDNLVAVAGVTVNGGRLAIPLVQPSSGTVELQLRAHRAVDAKAIRVSLPQPQANSNAPASVAVVAADNVELTPNREAIEGLGRQRIAPLRTFDNLPERQQEPLYYRGTGGPAVFAADLQVHRQRIAVDVSTQVTLNARLAEVEQRHSYAVAYEPVDHFTIAVPRELAAAKRIQVVCDGKPLTLVASADELAGHLSTAPISMRVGLPSPRLGTCDLVLQYSVALNEPTPQQSTTLALPLPMPENGQLVTNGATVKAARNTLASPRKDGAWTVVDRDPTALSDQTVLRLTAETAADRLDLDLRWEADDTAGAMIVDRAWVQTWLSASARQDRAVYQLTTNRKEIEVVIPDDAAVDQAVVLVDGKRVEAKKLAENRLLIPLPGPSEERRVALELLYHFADPRSPRGSLRCEFPHVGPREWIRRMYWQLVLPGNEHVVVNPTGFTGEFVWDWHGYFWGRQPLLDQSQLEAWVGAAPRAPLPDRVNVYLFSTLGDASQGELHTAGRTWIVLWASGAALVAGLLLIYVPVSRHPATLLVVGLGLFAAGFIAPEPTLLLAQAASLGLALALVAGLLERGVTRRRRKMAASKEPSSARVELGSTHSPHRLVLGNAQASTETLPAVQPPSPGASDR